MAARKSAARKSSARKSSSTRKTSARKTSSRRSAGRKTSARKTSARSSARKYGPKASQKVEKVMRERKRGTLRSGGSGKKVTSRKQAIAIGLSEARRSGAKVPSR